MHAKSRNLVRFSILQSTVVACIVLAACTTLETPGEGQSTHEDLLRDIESRILAASNQCYMDSDAADLYALKREILTWDVTADQQEAQEYWLAFADFNLAQLEAILGNPNQSKLLLEQALNSLRSMDSMNAEVRALLAILTQEKIRFAPGETFELVTQVRNQISTAMELDNENLRVQLANVMHSVIDIPGFGGATDPEEIIANALEKASIGSAPLNDKSRFSHPPTWGRARILGYEVVYLMNLGNDERAVETLNATLEEFPNHYWLMELATLLE